MSLRVLVNAGRSGCVMLELQAEVGCLALLPKAWFRLPQNKQPSKSTKVPYSSSDASDLLGDNRLNNELVQEKHTGM